MENAWSKLRAHRDYSGSLKDLSPKGLITGDLLQFRGGSSTENVSECSYAYLLWAMTNTQLLLTRAPATIGKTMRKAAARRRFDAGVSEEAIDEFVTPYAE